MKHSHYFKSVAGLTHVDVYRVLELFDVTDPCIQHAVKKLLVAGGRGVKAAMGQTVARDVQEAIDSLTRWQAMRLEDAERSAMESPSAAPSGPQAGQTPAGQG